MSTTLPEGLITGTASGVAIRLHLQPRASRTGICGIHGNELKVRVTSPPVDDAANELCIEFFAKTFRIPKSSISIISGQKSRHKKLFISGVDLKSADDLITTLTA